MPRFFFLCLLTAAMLPAQSVTVTSAVTTREPVPNNSCAVPPSESRFLATDSAVWVVFSYSGGQAGDNGYVEWFDPAGSLYTTNSFQQTSTGGSYIAMRTISESTGIRRRPHRAIGAYACAGITPRRSAGRSPSQRPLPRR